jgi:hypothetical protein
MWYDSKSASMRVKAQFASRTFNITSYDNSFALGNTSWSKMADVCRNESFEGGFQDQFNWVSSAVPSGTANVRGQDCEWWNLTFPGAAVNRSLCVKKASAAVASTSSDAFNNLPVRLLVEEQSHALPGMDVNFGIRK